mgnify:CR=1 FL=1
MYDFNTCYSQFAQTTEALQAQVEMILPLSKSEKYHAEEREAQGRLLSISQTYGIQWIPVPESLLLIRKRTERSELKQVQLPPALADFWQLLPESEKPMVFSAKVEYEQGQRVLLPCVGVKVGGSKVNGVYQDWETFEWDNLAQIQVFESSPDCKGEEDLAQFIGGLQAFEEDGVYCDEAGSWWLAWLFLQLQKLPAAVLVEVVTLLRPGLKVIRNGEDIGIPIKKKMLEYQFWFASGTILSNTGTETRLMEKCSIMGEGYKALPLFFVLCVLFGGKYEGSVPAFLNELPNAWARDEGSYGCKPEADHPTGVVNSDLRLPLQGRYKDWERGGLCMTRFPWVIPGNGKFTPTLLAQTIKSEGASAPDKYNLKSATGRLGCMALGMAMNVEKGMVWTIHDASKMPKWLNRPTQARIFNFLMGFIVREDGTEEPRQKGYMENTVKGKDA